MMKREDLSVVPSTCWKRDPLRSLSPKDLSDEDWSHIVELCYRTNPETLLMARPETAELESESTHYERKARYKAELECHEAEADFIAGVLIRRQKYDEECRETLLLSKAALRARRLSPVALHNHMTALMKRLGALGPVGVDRLGQVTETMRKRRRQIARLATPTKRST